MAREQVGRYFDAMELAVHRLDVLNEALGKVDVARSLLPVSDDLDKEEREMVEIWDARMQKQVERISEMIGKVSLKLKPRKNKVEVGWYGKVIKGSA